MALGVEGMRAGKVVRKAIFLTLGTAIFIFCLTLLYSSMRAVMDVGGACASGGAYEIRQACPKGVGWVVPISIFGMFFAGIFTFLGVFDEGGPKPFVFAFKAPTKAFNLKLSFSKSRVARSEVIEALEGILKELKSKRD